MKEKLIGDYSVMDDNSFFLITKTCPNSILNLSSETNAMTSTAPFNSI